MLQKELSKIPFADIDETDDAYRISEQTDVSALMASIRDIGLINPPVLQRKGASRFRIVVGFKRLQALTQLDVERVEAFIIAEEGLSLQALRLALEDKVTNGRLDAIELSTLIHKLRDEFSVDKNEIVSTWLPLAGYGRNPRVYELYADLWRLPAAWRQAVKEEQTPIDLAREMLERSEEERVVFLEFFQLLRLGKNRQREFTLLLSDVARIKNISLLQLVELQQVKGVIAEQKLTPPQKAERLKQWLWQERYPRYTKARENFEALLKQAKLPTAVFIQAPPYFEGERFSAGFHFASEEEFEAYVAALQRLLDAGLIRKIVDLP